MQIEIVKKIMLQIIVVNFILCTGGLYCFISERFVTNYKQLQQYFQIYTFLGLRGLTPVTRT